MKYLFFDVISVDVLRCIVTSIQSVFYLSKNSLIKTLPQNRYLIQQGEKFTKTEATDTFFAVTKLFQSKDVSFFLFFLKMWMMMIHIFVFMFVIKNKFLLLNIYIFI
jgi:hypothetical protein